MKALALLSGGLDSALAIKLLQEQDIDVVALTFTSPFITKTKAKSIAKKLNIPLKIISTDKNYLKLIKKPKYGYGKNLNPCIDCRIFIIKQAKKYAEKINAKFIFTGEVLNERPMSQNKSSLELVEKQTGLKGKLLRPLSAKLLPETQAEKKGWVDRNKLLAIKGRRRKPQLELARKYNLKGYTSPAGGCLLTNKEYSNRLRDLFEHNKKINLNDIKLLRFGRHFRFNKNKIIVGRNEKENRLLLKFKKSALVLEAKDFLGPITLLQGPKTKKAIKLAAQLTARYSDAKTDKIIVKYGNKKIIVNQIKDKEIEKLRI